MRFSTTWSFYWEAITNSCFPPKTVQSSCLLLFFLRRLQIVVANKMVGLYQCFEKKMLQAHHFNQLKNQLTFHTPWLCWSYYWNLNLKRYVCKFRFLNENVSCQEAEVFDKFFRSRTKTNKNWDQSDQQQTHWDSREAWNFMFTKHFRIVFKTYTSKLNSIMKTSRQVLTPIMTSIKTSLTKMIRKRSGLTKNPTSSRRQRKKERP